MDKCQPLRSATKGLQRVLGVEVFIFGHVSTFRLDRPQRDCRGFQVQKIWSLAFGCIFPLSVCPPSLFLFHILSVSSLTLSPLHSLLSLLSLIIPNKIEKFKEIVHSLRCDCRLIPMIFVFFYSLLLSFAPKNTPRSNYLVWDEFHIHILSFMSWVGFMLLVNYTIVIRKRLKCVCESFHFRKSGIPWLSHLLILFFSFKYWIFFCFYE